jgi:hypothetical protein
MNIKQLSELTDLSERTIQRKIKKMFPALINNGKTTDLSEEDSFLLINELKVKVSKQLRPRQNVGQNVELVKQILEPILKMKDIIIDCQCCKKCPGDSKIKFTDYPDNKIMIVISDPFITSSGVLKKSKLKKILEKIIEKQS